MALLCGSLTLAADTPPPFCVSAGPGGSPPSIVVQLSSSAQHGIDLVPGELVPHSVAAGLEGFRSVLHEQNSLVAVGTSSHRHK